MADSEGGGGRSLPTINSVVLMTLFKPTPSIDIVKFWQGIVEIALRGASVVLTFILFICACAAIAITNANVFISLEMRVLASSTSAAGGWLVFVTIFVMIIEGLIIAGRFLNFGFMANYGFIVYIVDIVVSFVTAAAIFCGTVAMAVYSGQWGQGSIVGPSTAATAAFGFFTIFAFAGLGAWMIASQVLKWRNVSKYSSSIAGSDDHDDAEQ